MLLLILWQTLSVSLIVEAKYDEPSGTKTSLLSFISTPIAVLPRSCRNPTDPSNYRDSNIYVFPTNAVKSATPYMEHPAVNTSRNTRAANIVTPRHYHHQYTIGSHELDPAPLNIVHWHTHRLHYSRS